MRSSRKRDALRRSLSFQEALEVLRTVSKATASEALRWERQAEKKSRRASARASWKTGSLRQLRMQRAVTPAREAVLLGSSPDRMEIKAMCWGRVRRSKGCRLDMVVSKKGKARSKSGPC
jgi:hypothetical protein